MSNTKKTAMKLIVTAILSVALIFGFGSKTANMHQGDALTVHDEPKEIWATLECFDNIPVVIGWTWIY